MAYWRRNPRFRREQFFIARRNQRYKLLVENVFSHLYETSDRLNNAPLHGSYSKLHLHYDLIKITKSPYYREANKHLIQDFPANIVHPEQLCSSVSKYNQDVDKFLNETVPNRCRDILQKIPEMTVTENPRNPPNNSFYFPNIVSDIKTFCVTQDYTEPSYEAGKLSGPGVKTWAFVDAEHLDIVSNAIRNLAKDNHFLRLLNGSTVPEPNPGLWSKRNDLIIEGKKLANYIHDNIIFEIEREEYRITCDECPNDDAAI